MLPEIKLFKVKHRKLNCIAIHFAYNDTLIALVRKVQYSKWSQSKRVWYIPYSERGLKQIKRVFTGFATINSAPELYTPVTETNRKPGETRNLTPEQRTILNNFYKYLRGKRYSKSTLDTYTMLVADFWLFILKHY